MPPHFAPSLSNFSAFLISSFFFFPLMLLLTSFFLSFPPLSSPVSFPAPCSSSSVFSCQLLIPCPILLLHLLLFFSIHPTRLPTTSFLTTSKRRKVSVQKASRVRISQPVDDNDPADKRSRTTRFSALLSSKCRGEKGEKDERGEKGEN